MRSCLFGAIVGVVLMLAGLQGWQLIAAGMAILIASVFCQDP